MVQICQLSLITLSVLSNYLFLYICIEYHTHLCQNIRRGRGESGNQFPMEIFCLFVFFFFFIYESQTRKVDLAPGRPGSHGLCSGLCQGFNPANFRAPRCGRERPHRVQWKFPCVPGRGLQLRGALVPQWGTGLP